MTQITQQRVDELFSEFRQSIADEEFEPSDLFQAVADAAASSPNLARAIADHTVQVLTTMGEERSWTWISLEVYRLTFFNLQELSKYGLGGPLRTESAFVQLVNYLSAILTGKQDPEQLQIYQGNKSELH